jgi:G:T-mismatch repair DNA endonuclease (very short patch repair protein)
MMSLASDCRTRSKYWQAGVNRKQPRSFRKTARILATLGLTTRLGTTDYVGMTSVPFRAVLRATRGCFFALRSCRNTLKPRSPP